MFSNKILSQYIQTGSSGSAISIIMGGLTSRRAMSQTNWRSSKY